MTSREKSLKRWIWFFRLGSMYLWFTAANCAFVGNYWSMWWGVLAVWYMYLLKDAQGKLKEEQSNAQQPT